MRKTNLIFSVALSLILFAGCGASSDPTPKEENPKTKVSEDVNTAPVGTFDTFSINKNVRYDGQLTATDADGDTLKYIIVNAPIHGTVVLHNNGCFTYTPDANYNGTDSFTFKANDSSLDSAPATVSITINSINDAPIVDAGADENITEGDSYSPNPTSSDIDGTIASTVWTEGATILTFPKTDFSVGNHILTVTVTDNEGAIATDTLTVTVDATATSCTPLHKTGQTITYHNNDDGDYQKGATKSYTRDDVNGIVTDNVTGLMWQDNEFVQKRWLTQEHYDARRYLNTRGDTATTYCTNLVLGGFDNWRLPSIEELVYLTDETTRAPAIDSIFESIYSGKYWSSTSFTGYSPYVGSTNRSAWEVSFYYGHTDYTAKNNNIHVRCVRDEQ